MVRYDDGHLAIDFWRMLACQHIHLALIDSQLADIDLQLEHVGALHTGVEDLRDGLLLGLLAAHDHRALLQALEAVRPRDLQNGFPVQLL